ncbi:MAG TPA: PH domain-containing protein [Flavobacterium sp.]|nr:PH domain-containing protein [Flavobacterium sp.]
MKVYKSKVSTMAYGLFFITAALLILPVFVFEDITTEDLKDSGFWGYLGLVCLVLIAFSTILFFTSYTIKDGFLKHRSGPFYGKMKIGNIQKIMYHSGVLVPVMYRPATATVGVIIKYNAYDDIYFSPEDRDTFVADLLKINPEIEVVKSEK